LANFGGMVREVGYSDNEVYYMCLQARKKYMPELQSSDKTQLKRVVCRKDNMLQKIQELECAVGVYKTKRGHIITNDAIALYITINPRDYRKACANTAKDLIDNINLGRIVNPYAVAMTQIHKSKGKTNFIVFGVVPFLFTN